MKKLSIVIMIGMMLLSACQGAETTGNSQENTTATGSEEQSESGVQSESEEQSESQSDLTEPEDTTPQPEPEPEPVITEIVVSTVGDCTLGRNHKQSYNNSFDHFYDQFGADYFLKNVKSIFEADDFTLVNLEGPLTNSDNIRTTKEWNHKGRPEYVNILTGSSVEGVTLGNNHIMDYQKDGVKDTLATVSEAGLAYALSGDWGHALGLYETKGIKIGFVSVNEYYDHNRVYKWLEDGIADLRQQGADIVIAAMHWGGDKVHKLEEAQYTMGKWCIDNGFDLVVGCHPHVIQGIEEYKGKYIVYSMGNFCYGGNKNPAEKESMIFQTTFTFVDGVLQPKTEGKVIPCRLSSVTNRNDFCPVPLEGEKGQAVIDQLNGYSEEFNLFIQPDGSIISKEDEE